MKSYSLLITILACVVPASGAFGQYQTPAAWEAQLLEAVPGSVIDLGTTRVPLNGNTLNASPNQLGNVGGALLYSDDPETVDTVGILYRDTVPAGPVRVYLYHVNGSGTAKRFSIVLENTGTSIATVTPTRRSFPTPSGNYVAVGREGSRLYYESTTVPPAIEIPAGGLALLDPEVDTRSINNNALLATIHDFTTNSPLRVSVVMVENAANTLAVFPSLAFSPNDGNNRQGSFTTFTRRNKTPYAYTTAGVKLLRIADGGTVNADPPLTGTDAERNASTTLPGNYGVTYEIDLAVTNTAARRLAVVLNPRGGNYAGYFRSRIGQGEYTGVTSSVVVSPPDTAITRGGVLAMIDPPATATNLRLEFIPAGASSLPVEILLLPFGTVAGQTENWNLY